jgi:CRP/FNR family cyclic AMP-dependent transcriptional regulator
MAQAAAQKKSGIKRFAPSDVLFNDGDTASSLYIIQSGQVRLYKPKGKGFIEIAILRTGEVIGEMAYFDRKGGTKRSCSAAAIMPTEAIEISFNAFEKTMEGLNPWFKTIINTLADRLRKTNEKVKALESNSAGIGVNAEYKFFNNTDVVKMLSLFYLIFKTHGHMEGGKSDIHMNKLKFYMLDIFNIQEVKYEEFIQMLKNEHFIEIGDDEDGLPKLVKVASVDRFRSLLVFFNTQRISVDEKKLVISDNCERFLKAILDQFILGKVETPKYAADITAVMEEFKQNNLPITDEDLNDAITAGLAEDIIIGDGGKLTSVVDYEKLKKSYPAIKMMNAIRRVNTGKNKTNKYAR